jgi:hypothetical protein
MSGYGKVNINGYLESSQVWWNGFVSLDKFAKDGDNNYYEYYNLTPDENGIFQPDYNALKSKLIEELENYYDGTGFRTLVVNGHPILNCSGFRGFIVEQLEGYRGEIEQGLKTKEDFLLNYTNRTTQTKIPLNYNTLQSILNDLIKFINPCWELKEDLIWELENSNDPQFIQGWLEASKASLDDFKELVNV